MHRNRDHPELLGRSVTPAGVRQALTALSPGAVANPTRGDYQIVDTELLAWLRTAPNAEEALDSH